MRSISFIVLICCCMTAHSETSSIPESTHKVLDKLDAKLNALNRDVRQNAVKIAECKSKTSALRERMNAAKDSEYQTRLSVLISKSEDQTKTYETMVADQRKTIAELMTGRRILSGAYLGETDEQRNAALGIVVANEAAQKSAAEFRKREEQIENQRTGRGRTTSNSEDDYIFSLPDSERPVRLSRDLDSSSNDSVHLGRSK